MRSHRQRQKLRRSEWQRAESIYLHKNVWETTLEKLLISHLKQKVFFHVRLFHEQLMMCLMEEEKLSRVELNEKVVNFGLGLVMQFCFFFSFFRRTKDGENATGETSRSATPSRDIKAKKQVSIDTKEHTKKAKRGKPVVEKKEEKKFAPKKFIRKSKRRKRKRNDPLYFGPLIECK